MGKRYVGMSAQSPDEKLKEHNLGATTWPRSQRPLTLLYSESFESKSEALKREKFFKSGDGRRVLEGLITRSLT